MLTVDAYPELLLAVREQEAILKNHGLQEGQKQEDSNNEVDIIVVREQVLIPYILDSSPPPPNYVDSPDVESDAGSIDSIRRNADFVKF